MLSEKALHKRKHPLSFRLCKGTVQAQLIQENKMREVDRVRVRIDWKGHDLPGDWGYKGHTFVKVSKRRFMVYSFHCTQI